MSLTDDWQPSLIGSWAEVLATHSAMTDALNNLQAAAGFLRELSLQLEALGDRQASDAVADIIFKLQFLSEGIDESVRRARELDGNTYETLLQVFPPGAGARPGPEGR